MVTATLVAFERIALACPFCGGKGASGLLENLLLVVGVWYLARRFMKSMERRRLRQQSPPASAQVDVTEPSRSR